MIADDALPAGAGGHRPCASTPPRNRTTSCRAERRRHAGPGHRPAGRIVQHRRQRVDRHDLRDLSGGRDAARPASCGPGPSCLAAGYVIYGPQYCLMVSFGDGRAEVRAGPETGASCWSTGSVAGPAEVHRICDQRLELPALAARRSAPISTIAWPGPKVRAATNFNMRWIASLVAETHRILTRGGVFLYPADDRKGYEKRPPAAALRMRADRLPDARRRAARPPTASTRSCRMRAGQPAPAHALRLRHRPTRSRASPPITTCPRARLPPCSAAAACSGAEERHEQEAPHHLGHRLVRRRHHRRSRTPSTRSSAARASRPSRSRATPSTATTAPR